jgi:hypothetical protein
MIALALLLALFATARGQIPVAIEFGSEATQQQIPPNFEGLSYESSMLLPRPGGGYYFSSTNAPLVQMFRTLGIKSLRVGGNSVDDPAVPIPGRDDVDSLFGFARAAGVKVIYSFRLKNGDKTASADLARYILDRYPESLDCFCIGNEPDVYLSEYPVFAAQWQSYSKAILEESPEARFCGPDAKVNNWAVPFAQQFGGTGKIAFIALHGYPIGDGPAQTNPNQARDQMLRRAGYDDISKTFVPAVTEAGLPYRLEETNNFYNGGARNVSDSYASALWGLDYLYWWAAHEADGLNFHTGDPSGPNRNPAPYSAIASSPGGVEAHPLAYALLAFHLAGGGRFLPARVSVSPDAHLNFKAYSTMAEDRSTFVTLINKEHGPAARGANVTLVFPPAMSPARGEVMFLRAPGGNVADKTGVTLGEAPIKEDGSWNGSWELLRQTSQPAGWRVQVPPASVAVVKLSP